MGTPAKRRKLNDSSKASGASPAKNLDFFFGKQKPPSSEIKQSEEASADTGKKGELTDEQLARKLQAEWNNEVVEQPGGIDATETEDKNGPGSTGHNAISAGEGRISDRAEISEETVDSSQSKSKDRPASLLFGNKTLSLQSMGTAEDTITANIPFDESPLTFEPLKYVADLQKHWWVFLTLGYGQIKRCAVGRIMRL